MKKYLITLSLVLIFVALLFVGCNKDKVESVKNESLIHEPEFGGIYITKTIEEFNAMGYEYGDSVDLVFSNGYKLLDLPYYNGYYVDAGNALLVGYPGYDYIKAAINYGDDLWDIAKVSESDTATISLNQKGKYKSIQEASDIHYFDEREKYSTDVEFANFRNITTGNIKEGILYRSASPCDNKHKRAPYVDRLMEQGNVQYILNLADTKEKIDSYIAQEDFNSPYFRSIYEGNKFFLMATKDEKVEPLAMNMNYRSEEFKQKLVPGFINMSASSGPYLVHCLEGKDRTGFVCILIEALMDSTYKEIVDDYMLTYDNYYGIKAGELKYDIIKARNVDAMLRFIINDENADLSTANLSQGAKEYMLSGGMTQAQLDTFINCFAKA